MRVDLRSDTITKPTTAMRAFMMQAEVGDDVFGEDITINLLEEKIATILGAEAALFCPTATMCNQIAIKILTSPLDEIIADKLSHIYNYEVGGYAFNSGVSIRLVEGDWGRISPQQITDNINPADVHKPITSLVCLENTCNKGGGSIYRLPHLQEIKTVCDANNLKLHLDGSRLFNALVETKDDTTQYGKIFDTITICLSKGLGCPVGALLVGKKQYISKAERVRKVFGGGMRQAGIIAAAGIYALDNHIEQLRTDHAHAREIAGVLQMMHYIEKILPVESNIIIFTLKPEYDADHFITYLTAHDIHAFAIGENAIRFVTHLDVYDEMVEKVKKVIPEFV
ncbi:MAG: aminotransferase class I/II-fold pyridoxal phosphate-dependent enzyme [Chitinophagales bacterium]|nr:aminotransferase class I/II-fold pyridoxal phosphate-dependent enzyme [Chitinophagales bacterium]